MSGSFWLSYIFALVVVALLLGGLYAVVRGLARGRLLASAQKRLVTVLESTQLSQHAALHVVKVSGRYFLLGGGQAGVHEIAELPAGEVEEWLANQRTLLGNSKLNDVVKSLRGKS